MKHLGIIEGFYGLPWPFQARHSYIPFLLEHAYNFYLYCPKADAYLRENWQQSAPPQLHEKLKDYGGSLRNSGIDWGFGLSPMGLHENFNESNKSALKDKLEELKDTNSNWLAILFDDMKGDFPDLAKTQIEICHFVLEHTDFDKLLMCPSYYCDDPILDKVFGQRPERYLEELGESLDKSIEVFWTGQKVCSTSYPSDHLSIVTDKIQRKPFLWDNYPVNDGALMSPHLHLKAFTGRENLNNENIAGHGVNPMNEAYLSQLPLASLRDSYNNSDKYDSKESWQRQGERILGQELFHFLNNHIQKLQDEGWHKINDEEKNQLKEELNTIRNSRNENFVTEIIEFLEGKYIFNVQDQVPTQELWQD